MISYDCSKVNHLLFAYYASKWDSNKLKVVYTFIKQIRAHFNFKDLKSNPSHLLATLLLITGSTYQGIVHKTNVLFRVTLKLVKGNLNRAVNIIISVNQ